MPHQTGNHPAGPVCAFCGQPATAVPCSHDGQGRLKPRGGCLSCEGRDLGHTTGLWACPCTAVGSGAWDPDLDEAVALLQGTLGIELNEAQVDHLRQFERDHFNSFALLQETFRLNYYELARNAICQGEVPLQWLWARRTSS